MLPKGLVVSCRTFEDEPVHSPSVMGMIAKAALQGGASGVYAGALEDIREIHKSADLPVIGSITRCYPGSDVYLTPTMREVDELAEAETEIIALDATFTLRPRKLELKSFLQQIREKYPAQLLMAECSTFDEAMQAAALGFDYIGLTLVGYTRQSEELKLSANDYELLRKLVDATDIPVIVFGNIDSPAKARRILVHGCHCVIVGSAITRPKHIIRKFTSAMEGISCQA